MPCTHLRRRSSGPVYFSRSYPTPALLRGDGDPGWHPQLAAVAKVRTAQPVLERRLLISYSSSRLLTR